MEPNIICCWHDDDNTTREERFPAKRNVLNFLVILGPSIIVLIFHPNMPKQAILSIYWASKYWLILSRVKHYSRHLGTHSSVVPSRHLGTRSSVVPWRLSASRSGTCRSMATSRMDMDGSVARKTVHVKASCGPMLLMLAGRQAPHTSHPIILLCSAFSLLFLRMCLTEQ
jgi:hypothetical protein